MRLLLLVCTHLLRGAEGRRGLLHIDDTVVVVLICVAHHLRGHYATSITGSFAALAWTTAIASLHSCVMIASDRPVDAPRVLVKGLIAVLCHVIA